MNSQKAHIAWSVFNFAFLIGFILTLTGNSTKDQVLLSGIALILSILVSTIVLINKMRFESEKALKKQTTFYLCIAIAVGLLLFLIYFLK